MEINDETTEFSQIVSHLMILAILLLILLVPSTSKLSRHVAICYDVRFYIIQVCNVVGLKYTLYYSPDVNFAYDYVTMLVQRMEVSQDSVEHMKEEAIYQLNKTKRACEESFLMSRITNETHRTIVGVSPIQSYNIYLRFAESNYTFENFEIRLKPDYKEGIYVIKGQKQMVFIKINASLQTAVIRFILTIEFGTSRRIRQYTNSTYAFVDNQKNHYGFGYTGAFKPGIYVMNSTAKNIIVKMLVQDQNLTELSHIHSIIDVAQLTECNRRDRRITTATIYFHHLLRDDVFTIELYDQAWRLLGKSSDTIGFNVSKPDERHHRDFEFIRILPMMLDWWLIKVLETLTKNNEMEKSIMFMVTYREDFNCTVNRHDAYAIEWTSLKNVIRLHSECMEEASRNSGIWYRTKIKKSRMENCKSSSRVDTVIEMLANKEQSINHQEQEEEITTPPGLNILTDVDIF
ncbi:hypothetical protein RF11_15059 [Thelohanellus kitauei]|uniref:Uncharacterized protein n=1 Tax=Thelohanellus kitauei TaxID=669202 RepID=A0A0C2J408_THEKT|nr:hypothetical protein RF11_15059 [Thelohanellus kitauei]